MIEFLITPWQQGDWMARAMGAALLAAIVCAPVGTILYLRGQSMLADALAHVALPGIVFAFLATGRIATGPMLAGAVITGVLSAWAIDALGRVRRVAPDAAIGIVFTALFALGALLLSSQLRGIHLDLDHALYGNILGVSDASMRLLALLAPAWLIGMVAFRRVLVLTSFDARYAASVGVPVGAVTFAITAVASMTAVASFEAVGAVLAVALFVVPAATAHLVARTPVSMVLAATGFGVSASICGVYVSIAADVSTSGCIVCIAGVQYGLLYLFAPEHGVLSPRVFRPVSASRRREPGCPPSPSKTT